MAYYYSIPIEEMEEELESLRFYPVNLVFRNKPVKEWVYERKLPRSPNHFVRIYTGIQRYGQSAGESRKAGKDAIRIQVIYRDAKGETLVSQTKRVHRVGGWRKNLHKRMDEVATELPQVEFDSRGEPMTLRKKGKNQFWGSRDYPKFKETKPFRAEGGNQVIRFDTLDDFHNYVKNHPYYIVEAEKQRKYMRAESREEFEKFAQTQPIIILDFDCYTMRNLKAEMVGITYNHVVPLGNVSFQNISSKFIPRDLVQEYGAPQSASFHFSQDYQHTWGSQRIRINLNGLPFTINWSWSAQLPEYAGGDYLELWLWKIPLSSIENKEELNFTDVAELNTPSGQKWRTLAHKRMYAADEAAEEIRCCKECDKTTGLTTIQAGTYCYDCLPINLGAEEKVLCGNCNWSWNRSEGGDDLFICHKCGTDTQVFNAEDNLDYRDYLNDLRTYPELKNLSDEQLLARGIDCLALQTANRETFAADDYDATYGKEQAKIRRRLKNKIKKQAIMGTKAGQWSARKSQELKRQYEAACDKKGLNPYKGKKTKSQDNLSKWSKQKWGTASGKKSSTTGEPYFPAKAVAALKKKDLYSKAKRQKTKATRAGKQNARYSDDIRKVVAQYRAEDEDIVIADFKNMSKKERDTYAPDNWKIEMYWAADGSTYILRRIFKPESYGAVVDLIDEINVIAAELDHHALITFDKERVMVQLWTHDVHNITELDIAFAELLNQFADKWELNAESPEWDDIDWKTDKPPAKEHEDWGDDVEWDAESYLERDSRVRRELDEGLLSAGRDMPMQKYEYRRIKKFNTPEELHEFANNVKGWRDNWGQDKHNNYVYVCDFDWYVKRVTNNPIYTLYGHIIPLSNFSSGWSDQSRRDDKLVKRYGAPIFVQSPVMGKIMTTLKDVRKISDEKMGQSNSSMVGHGMKGLTMKLNPDEDSVLIINMKGLKFAYGKGYFGEFSDIMVLGGLPVKNVVGHRYKKPEYRALNEQRHWKVTMDREDFARMNDRRVGRYSAYDNAYRDRFDGRISQYNRGFGSEDEEITMKEFDDTTADDFVDDADDRIVLMLRKKSKINRYGDIGCPVCGSIGLFYEEIIAKGKKWYCYGCLYEDKEETIKGKGDITLEKYGLEITCPICKKAVKAFNNDSMLRHMKKCGVPK